MKTSKNIKIQRYEAIINLCLDLLSDKDIDNGGITTVSEMLALARGRLRSLKNE